MSLVRVSDLLKQHVLVREGPRQHQGLLIMNVVVVGAVHQHKFLELKISDVPRHVALLVIRQIIVLRWQTHETLRVDRIWKNNEQIKIFQLIGWIFRVIVEKINKKEQQTISDIWIVPRAKDEKSEVIYTPGPNLFFRINKKFVPLP